MDRTLLRNSIANWRMFADVNNDAVNEDEWDDTSIPDDGTDLPNGIGKREQAMSTAILAIVTDQGKWGQDNGPDGVTYFPSSPFHQTYTQCDDCIFYEEGGGAVGTCRAVAGMIEKDGWCHLFIREPGANVNDEYLEPDRAARSDGSPDPVQRTTEPNPRWLERFEDPDRDLSMPVGLADIDDLMPGEDPAEGQPRPQSY